MCNICRENELFPADWCAVRFFSAGRSGPDSRSTPDSPDASRTKHNTGRHDGGQCWVECFVRSHVFYSGPTGNARETPVMGPSGNFGEHCSPFDVTTSLRARPLDQTGPILGAFRLCGGPRERATRPAHGLSEDWPSLNRQEDMRVHLATHVFGETCSLHAGLPLFRVCS